MAVAAVGERGSFSALLAAYICPAVCTVYCGCSMPSDAQLDPMRRLSRMMERTMKAEFSFPPDKPLRWGGAGQLHAALPPALGLGGDKVAWEERLPHNASAGSDARMQGVSVPPCLPAACSDGLKDLISRILVRDPSLRPTLHVSLRGDRLRPAAASQQA